jgi:hypothetical protein
MNEKNSTITGTNMKVHGSKLTYFTFCPYHFNPVKTGSLNDLTDLKFSFHVSIWTLPNFPHVERRKASTESNSDVLPP